MLSRGSCFPIACGCRVTGSDIKAWVAALDEPAAVLDEAGGVVASNEAWSAHRCALGVEPRGASWTAALEAREEPAAGEAISALRSISQGRMRTATADVSSLFGATPTQVVTLAMGDLGDGAGVLVRLRARSGPARSRAEETTRSRLRTVLAGAPVVLFGVDRSGVLTLVDGMLGNSTALLGGEAVGRSVFEVCKHLPTFLEAVRAGLGGSRALTVVEVGPIAYEVRVEPWVSPDDDRWGAVGVATDVSDRIRAERAKEELVAIVSHELRTPLTSVHGSLRLLQGFADGFPPKAARLVELSRNNTERLLRLIGDVLDLDRAEAGRLSLQRKETSGASVLDAALDEMRGLAEGSRITLVAERAENVRVYVDPDRIVQVLVNLLSNAIKHSPPGEVVRASVAADGTMVRWAVEDRGPGIPEEDRPQLFRKFGQLGQGRSAQGGAGLGLAISRELVRLHGGHIGIEPGAEGGSTFYFVIPAAADRGRAERPVRKGERDQVTMLPLATIANPHDAGLRLQLERLHRCLVDAQGRPDARALREAYALARIAESVAASEGATSAPTLGEVRRRLERALDDLADGRTATDWAALAAMVTASREP